MLLIGSAPASAQATAYSRQKLDVLLLIDDSASMHKTDPSRIRYHVASAFAGFLKLNTDTVDGRIGIIRFGSYAKPLYEGLLLAEYDDEIRDALHDIGYTVFGRRYYPSLGGTDFEKALEAAYRKLEDAGALGHASESKTAVVLLTDGWADTLSVLQSPARRFEGIRNQAARLKEAGCDIVVIYTGNASKYESQWREIASPGRSYSISGMEHAPRTYRDILAYLTGREFGQELFDACMEGDKTVSLVVEPYLEKIVFTIFKRSESRAIRLTLARPDGETLLPTSPGVIHTIGVADEGYSIPKPQSGKWTVTLEGDGCVSAWADRYTYEIEVDTPSEEDVLFAGDLMFVKAYLYDQTEDSKMPIASDSSYPLVFQATVRSIDGGLFETLLMDADPGTRSVFSGETTKPIPQGDYTVDVVAGAEGIPHTLKATRVEGIEAIAVPRLTEAFVDPQQVSVGQTASLVARFTGLEAVTVDTQFDVNAHLVDPDGSQYAERIQLIRVPEKNEYIATVGCIDEAGNVTEFTEEDPKGTYQVVVKTTFVSSPDRRFESYAEAGFCLRHKLEDLPAIGEAFLADRQGNRVNRIPFATSEEYWIEAPIENVSIANPDSLAVSAEIRGPNQEVVASVRLVRNPDRPGDLSSRLPDLGTFTGLWGTRSYSVKLPLEEGRTTYDCEFPEDTGMWSFVAYVLPPLWVWLVLGVVGALLLYGLIWLLFLKPLVKPIVGGRLELTNPNGDVLPLFELDGLGKRITLGSEGMVMLDTTLDPEVSGIVAEIQARVVRRRFIRRSVVFIKEGKRSEDIYNGDVFWVGRYRIQYVNTAAERESAPW